MRTNDLDVVFKPAQSVIFQPTMTRQETLVEITNNGPTDILVKWKSTQPALLRMSPGFSIIPSKETASTELRFKGIEKEQCSKKGRDRFSIVIAPISPTTTDAKTIWKDKQIRDQLLMGKIVKKTIFLLFAGVNDTVDFDHKRDEKVLEDVSSDEDMHTTRTAGHFSCILIPLDTIETTARDADPE